MRAPPRQTVHRPFGPGPYRMGMDLVTAAESQWFEFDHHYHAERTEKQRLFATLHHEVFAATPGSEAARAETLDVMLTALTTHHPDWFSRTHNHLANRPLDTADDPLQQAALLVQEDLCLIQDSPAGPLLTAAALCFPSRWRLLDKIGKPLAAVHGPVPLYADRLARPVDRFMRHLKTGRTASRLNWSLLDDPALYQPGGKWRTGARADIAPADVGTRVYLRVERQTLRRLPVSGAVLFGIRVHVYPLEEVIDTPDRAATLAEAVRALPPEIQHYKSLSLFRQPLLQWLAQAATHAPA